MTYVVYPLVQATDSIAALRIWLGVVSSVGLFFSFHLWVRIAGWIAPIAAAVAASFWVTVFFGTEVQPNLWVAFAAVAGLAFVVRHRRTGALGDLAGLSFSVAFLFLFRPADALVVGTGFVIVAFGLSHYLTKGFFKVAGAVAAGVVAGFTPWIVEAFQDYGNPLQRWDEASRYVRSSWRIQIMEYLRLSDGPMQSPDLGPVPVGFLFWLGFALVAVIAAFALARGPLRKIAIAATTVAALSAAPYLLYVGSATIRFLLPASLSVAIAVAVGVFSVIEHRRWGIMAVLGVLMAVASWWNFTTLVEFANSELQARESAREVGEEILALADGNACSFLSQYKFPVIAYTSGCSGGHLPLDGESKVADLADITADTRFVLLTREAPDGLLAGDWLFDSVEARFGGRWYVYWKPAG